jgi:hypothetical protein
MDHRKISISSLVCSLILFAFPWVIVDCNGTEIVSQSGFQAAYAGGSTSKKIERAVDSESSAENELPRKSDPNGGSPGIGKEKQKIGVAVLTILSLLCVIGAFALHLMSLKNARIYQGPAQIAAVAGALLLVLQLIVGFPLEDSVEKSVSEMPTRSGAAIDVSAKMALAMNIDARRTAWVYLCVIFIAGGATGAIMEFLAKRSPRDRASR